MDRLREGDRAAYGYARAQGGDVGPPGLSECGMRVDTFGYILIRIDTLSIRDGTQRTHATLSHYVRYEQFRGGVMPRGVNYNWEKACDVKINSMRCTGSRWTWTRPTSLNVAPTHTTSSAASEQYIHDAQSRYIANTDRYMDNT